MKVSSAEWKRRKKDLLTYLKEHPSVSFGDLRGTEYRATITALYKNILNKAKRDAGVSEDCIRECVKIVFSDEEWEAKKKELDGYLIENPDATSDDVIENGHRSSFSKFYGDRINRAKEAVGVGMEHLNRWLPDLSDDEWEARKNDLLEFIRNNPNVTRQELFDEGHRYTLTKFFDGVIQNAKVYASMDYAHVFAEKSKQQVFENSMDNRIPNSRILVVDEKDLDANKKWNARRYAWNLAETMKSVLTEKELAAMKLRYAFGMDYHEIGFLLNTSYQAQSQAHTRAVEKLKEAVKTVDIDSSKVDIAHLRELMEEFT